jgi:hypothetical protein
MNYHDIRLATNGYRFVEFEDKYGAKFYVALDKVTSVCQSQSRASLDTIIYVLGDIDYCVALHVDEVVKKLELARSAS